MITIKELNNNTAELNIEKGTPHFTYLLGIEMLIETILEEVPTMTIDDILCDLKRIYERDNWQDKNNML